MKYVKRPIPIEAIQLHKNNIEQVYKFIHGENSVKLTCKMAEERWDEYCDLVEKKGLNLKTLESGEGTQIASIGDYIIKGIRGEFYPCKPDIFEESYTPFLE